MKTFCWHAAIVLGAVCLTAAGIAAPSPPRSSEGWRFHDARCPFAAMFSSAKAPTVENLPDAQSAEQTGPGYRLSAACIANSSGVAAPPLEGAALYDRLSSLAKTLGVGATITVPTATGPNCGLIEGRAQRAGKPISTRTVFCYGARAYFIVETTTDGSAAADRAAAALLATIEIDRAIPEN